MRDSYTNRNHRKCGRIRWMVVVEGGRSTGVLLYFISSVSVEFEPGVTFFTIVLACKNSVLIAVLDGTPIYDYYSGLRLNN